jgi:NAD-dependent DNA ligase
LIGKNGEKAYDSLHAKLHNVHLWELMAAWPYFGRGFGKRRAKALVETFGLKVFDVELDDIVKIAGFQEKSSEAFFTGLSSFTEFYDWLYHEELYTPIKIDDIIDTELKLSGQKFVFTKFRDAAAQARIEELGGTVEDGVKKDTTYLVVKDVTAETNKTKQATKLGVKIISINEMMELIS